VSFFLSCCTWNAGKGLGYFYCNAHKRETQEKSFDKKRHALFRPFLDAFSGDICRMLAVKRGGRDVRMV
jgi:hypothetical protein